MGVTGTAFLRPPPALAPRRARLPAPFGAQMRLSYALPADGPQATLVLPAMRLRGAPGFSERRA